MYIYRSTNESRKAWKVTGKVEYCAMAAEGIWQAHFVGEDFVSDAATGRRQKIKCANFTTTDS